MDSFLVSLSNNILRVSLHTSEGIVAIDKKLPKEIVSDTKINNIEEFSKELGALILEKFGEKNKINSMQFLLGPDEVLFRFLTLPKSQNDIEETLEKEATKKLVEEDFAVETTYYSYQKIAPFVYQLVAVSHDTLDSRLEIAANLGMSLTAVFPWAAVLPRLINGYGKPCIFALSHDGKNQLALAELGGIYHMGAIGDTSDINGIADVVKQLSIYKRDDPITEVYTLNMDDLKFGDSFKVQKLPVEAEDTAGFEPHILYANAIELDQEILQTHFNLLGAMPTPVIDKKPFPTAYVSVLVGSLLLVGSFIAGASLLKENGFLTQNSEVLSEENIVEKNQEVTESTETVEDKEVEESVVLDKNLLIIRVENATQVGGLAGEAQGLLESLEFDISGGVGDYDGGDRTSVLIRFKKDFIDYSDMVVEVLTGDFEQFETSNDLSESSTYNTLIILGK